MGTFALLMAAVVLGGVIASQVIGSSDASAPASPDLAGVVPGAPSSGPAPGFTIDLFFDAGVFGLSEHLATDGRPVILNLWASWCYPCRAEMPHFDAAAMNHPEVQFVGIAVEDSLPAALAFAEEVQVSYPLGHDTDGIVDIHYPAPGLPATYVIDSGGQLVRIAYGSINEAQIEALIAEVGGN